MPVLFEFENVLIEYDFNNGYFNEIWLENCYFKTTFFKYSPIINKQISKYV